MLSPLQSVMLDQSPTYDESAQARERRDHTIAAMSVVLVIDDDEFTCDAIRRLLDRMGYATACANSGSDALELIEQVRPDLIVLDWMMPEMDGLAVLRKLRSNPETKDVPVVVYSAADDVRMRKQAAKLGAKECVLKSGGFYPLYERIERYASPQ